MEPFDPPKFIYNLELPHEDMSFDFKISESTSLLDVVMGVSARSDKDSLIGESNAREVEKYGVAIKSYTAKDPLELSIDAGDIILVLSTSVDGKVYGKLNNKYGFFLSDCIKMVKDDLKIGGTSDIQDHIKDSSNEAKVILRSKSTASLSIASAVMLKRKARTPRQSWVDYIGGAEELIKLNLSKQEIKRQEVILEIITTEADYIDDLDIVFEHYIRPLQKNKLVKAKDIAVLFSNMEQVLPVNQELLRSLEIKQLENKKIELIGEELIRVSDYLKMYKMYCSNHPYALMKLQALRQTKAIAKFFDAAAQHPDCRQMDLGSFLLKPIQRVCKYPLLIRDLIRATDPAHPDSDNLGKALFKVETVVSAINEGARLTEEVHKMLELQAKFSTKVNLVAPSRTLVRSGQINAENATGIMRCREVYLFNDMLVVAKIDGERLKLLNMIHFDAILIHEAPADPSAGFTFIEVVHIGCVTLKLQFDSNEGRESWLSSIRSSMTDWTAQRTRMGMDTRHARAASSDEAQRPTSAYQLTSPTEQQPTPIKRNTLSSISPAKRESLIARPYSLNDTHQAIIVPYTPPALLNRSSIVISEHCRSNTSPMMRSRPTKPSSKSPVKREMEAILMPLRPDPKRPPSMLSRSPSSLSFLHHNYSLGNLVVSPTLVESSAEVDSSQSIEPLILVIVKAKEQERAASLGDLRLTSKEGVKLQSEGDLLQIRKALRKPVASAIIEGVTSNGKYIIQVNYLKGEMAQIQRGVAEFYTLKVQLEREFNCSFTMTLPSKIIFEETIIAESRRISLQYFIEAVLALDSRISRSPLVLQFFRQ